MTLSGGSDPGFVRCVRFLSFSPSGGRDGSPVLAAGREDAVETGEVDAGFGYQGGEACNEVERFEDHVGRSVPPGVFEGVADLAVFSE